VALGQRPIDQLEGSIGQHEAGYRYSGHAGGYAEVARQRRQQRVGGANGSGGKEAGQPQGQPLVAHAVRQGQRAV